MRFYNTLQRILAPTAFKAGILITLVIFCLSYKYYTTPRNEIASHPFLNLIHIFHQKSIDIRMVNRGEQPISDNVAILAIDEESLERFGRWPWPRNVMSDLITELEKNKSKVIAFDIIFSEEEKHDAQLAQTLNKYSNNIVLGTYFDQSYAFAPYQAVCTRAIDESSPTFPLLENQTNSIIAIDQTAIEIPSAIHSYLKTHMRSIEDSLKDSSPYPHEVRKNILEAKENFCFDFLVTEESITNLESHWDLSEISASEWASSYKAASLQNPVHHAGRFWINTPEITKASKHYAYFNAFLDSDGYIRRTKLVARHGSLIVPSLALKTILTAYNLSAMMTLNIDPNNPTSKRVAEFLLTDNETGDIALTIPADTDTSLNINYAGPQKTFPHLSVHEVLRKSDTIEIVQRRDGVEQRVSVNKGEFLKDKIILIGATAVGIYDLRVTPFAENFPGVEVHANIIENIIAQSYFKSFYDEEIYMLLFIFGFGILFSFILSKVGAINGLLISVGSLLGTYVVDRFFLFSKGYIICIIFPIALTITIYVLLTFYKYLTEERKKKELKGIFQKYVSPSVVNEILSAPEKVSLGGRKENMSVMFSDVRGFTTLSERLAPEVLSDFLNRYLTPMTQIVFRYNGTLDKYIGDAIMAFWGAPITSKDHAKDACLAALEMIEKLKDLNKEFQQENLPPLEIGIGVNTGDMSVGNMGSDIVRSYTVMGDSVNLASRLEGINKNYGTQAIISETTYAQIKEDFFVRALDSVRVKGKRQPVKIFELISTNKNVNSALKEAYSLFEQASEKYSQRQFADAEEMFRQVLNRIPHDIPSKIYIQRCQSYIHSPPPGSWDGVFDFETK